jgi:hypothetical protein
MTPARDERQVRRKWSTIPKSRARPSRAGAFHNQPSRFTTQPSCIAWSAYISASVREGPFHIGWTCDDFDFNA